MGKLVKLSTLTKIIGKLRKHRKRIVFTNGCFDLLHPGHLKILREAKAKGDVLVVGLNSDRSVKKIKGRSRPILNQTARAELLASLEIVDYVLLFSEETPLKVIGRIRPDVLVKGMDWKSQAIIGSDIVGQICRIRLRSGYSTTSIIKKIQGMKARVT